MTTHKNLSIRLAEKNPNQHLYRDHGLWWIHCTGHPIVITVHRVRRGLGRRNLLTARRGHDEVFSRARLRAG